MIRHCKKYSCHTATAKHVRNLICTMNLGQLALRPGASLAVLTGVASGLVELGSD